MADHVAVGEVQNDHVVLVLIDAGKYCVSHFIGAHFGLQIEGRNLLRGRRRNQDAILAGEGALFAAVEEERDVRVLLRFGDAQLGLAALGQVFAHRHMQ